jgi:hypothetical protein
MTRSLYAYSIFMLSVFGNLEVFTQFLYGCGKTNNMVVAEKDKLSANLYCIWTMQICKYNLLNLVSARCASKSLQLITIIEIHPASYVLLFSCDNHRNYQNIVQSTSSIIILKY